MQIACNFKSSFLAAADDGGDVKVFYYLFYFLFFTFLYSKYNLHWNIIVKLI